MASTNNHSTTGEHSDSKSNGFSHNIYWLILVYALVLVEIVLITTVACWKRACKRKDPFIRLRSLKKTKKFRMSEMPRKAFQSYIFPMRKTLVTFVNKSEPTSNIELLRYVPNNTPDGSAVSLNEDNHTRGALQVESVGPQTFKVNVDVEEPPKCCDTDIVSLSKGSDRADVTDVEKVSQDVEKPDISSFVIAERDSNSIYSTIPSVRKYNLIHSANKHFKYIPTSAYIQEQRVSNVYCEIQDSTENREEVLSNLKPFPKIESSFSTLPKEQAKSLRRKLNVQCWSNPCATVPIVSLVNNNHRTNASESHIYSEIHWRESTLLQLKNQLETNTPLEGVRTSDNMFSGSESDVFPFLSLDTLVGICVDDPKKSDYDSLVNLHTEYIYAPFREIPCSPKSLTSGDSYSYVEFDVEGLRGNESDHSTIVQLPGSLTHSMEKNEVEAEQSPTNGLDNYYLKNDSILFEYSVTHNDVSSDHGNKASHTHSTDGAQQNEYWTPDGAGDTVNTFKTTGLVTGCLTGEALSVGSEDLIEGCELEDESNSDDDYVGLDDVPCVDK